MTSPTQDEDIALGRIWWVGPTTIAAGVLVVVAIQRLLAALLGPLPKGLGPLDSIEPAVVGTVCITAAVLVFVAVVREASRPVRTYRRIAFGVLLLSFLPDLILGATAAPGINLWPIAGIFDVMHVAAWAVTVTLLTKLTVVDRTSATGEVGRSFSRV
jgi:hypothetical protein